MEVRVRWDPLRDMHIVEYKKWYTGWRYYGSKYMRDAAIRMAEGLKNPIITEIK